MSAVQTSWLGGVLAGRDAEAREAAKNRRKAQDRKAREEADEPAPDAFQTPERLAEIERLERERDELAALLGL